MSGFTLVFGGITQEFGGSSFKVTIFGTYSMFSTNPNGSMMYCGNPNQRFGPFLLLFRGRIHVLQVLIVFVMVLKRGGVRQCVLCMFTLNAEARLSTLCIYAYIEYIHIYIYICMYIYMCVCVAIYIHMCVCVSVCAYVHSYIYIYKFVCVVGIGG